MSTARVRVFRDPSETVSCSFAQFYVQCTGHNVQVFVVYNVQCPVSSSFVYDVQFCVACALYSAQCRAQHTLLSSFVYSSHGGACTAHCTVLYMVNCTRNCAVCTVHKTGLDTGLYTVHTVQCTENWTQLYIVHCTLTLDKTVHCTQNCTNTIH